MQCPITIQVLQFKYGDLPLFSQTFQCASIAVKTVWLVRIAIQCSVCIHRRRRARWKCSDESQLNRRNASVPQFPYPIHFQHSSRYWYFRMGYHLITPRRLRTFEIHVCGWLVRDRVRVKRFCVDAANNSPRISGGDTWCSTDNTAGPVTISRARHSEHSDSRLACGSRAKSSAPGAQDEPKNSLNKWP